MNLGVILNRVFRINDNPLFHYINEHKEDIDQLAILIPIEDMSDVNKVKQQYYYDVAGSLIEELKQYNIQPFIIPYNQLEELCYNLELTHVLMAKDIMSYNNEENDYILARRMQDEENAAAMAGPSNHRRTRSADVVTTHSNGYAYLMILVSFEADGNFSYIGGNNSGPMYTGKCRQL